MASSKRSKKVVLPERIRTVFEAEVLACTTKTPDEGELRRAIDRYREHLEVEAQRARHSDRSTLNEVFQAAALLLGRFQKSPVGKRILIAAAIRYLVRSNDALVDDDEFMGLEDDLDVLNFVTQQLTA